MWKQYKSFVRVRVDKSETVYVSSNVQPPINHSHMIYVL